MTIKKYTRCLILKICVLKKKKYKIKTCKSVWGAIALLIAILRLDYQFSFPNEVQLRQGFPRQKNEWDRQWYKDNRDEERTETKLSEGRRQQEYGEESQNQYFD